jgi:hypothetical protein
MLGVPLDLLLGPAAALALAIAIIGFLAKILLDYINHLKDQVKDLTKALADQAAATNRVADVLEAERAETLMRRRIKDGLE